MLEIVKNNNIIYAIIIRSDYNKPGPNFFTENDARLQIGSMVYSKGKLIEPHYHKNSKKINNKTSEALFIKKGKLKVNFYCPDNGSLLEEKILKDRDVIMIQEGAHGFEVLEDIEMIEVKIGPYNEDDRVHIKK